LRGRNRFRINFFRTPRFLREGERRAALKAVLLTGFGGVETLRIGEWPDPVMGSDEILVQVRATALNRADLLQRRGKYPPPPGASEILGLEAAGEVVAAGPGAGAFRPGDRVCAPLQGGGYAQRVAVPGALAIPIPGNLSFEEAAAVPEVFLTAWRALFDLGDLAPGRAVLVHAGASGVGTAAIQLIREGGGDAFVTAGSSEKINRCLELGAKAGWNHREGPFAPWLAAQTAERGVDIILDLVGGPYFEQNLASLAPEGRLVLIGMLGGARAERVDLGRILFGRVRIIGSTLRSLDGAARVRLVRDFSAFALPRLADGRLAPVVDSVFDWTDAAAAHARMEANANVGKIVLRVSA
jgi:tumor protein p53-inducible protein 3